MKTRTMRTLIIWTPSMDSQDAELPSVLVLEDPSGRTLLALAEENAGELKRTKRGGLRAPFTSDGRPTYAAVAVRFAHVTNRYLRTIRRYGDIVIADQLQHMTDIGVGADLRATALGLQDKSRYGVGVETLDS